jgi:hypothetical protein
MGLMDALFGKKEQFKQIPTMTGQQQGFQNQALGQMQSLLGPGGGLDPRANEAEARGNFMGKTVPGIAELFSSMGQGGQRSSGFQGALGAAGAGLERGLASDRSSFNMNMLNSLMGPGMQSSFDTYHQPATQGLFQQFAGPAAMMGMNMGAQHGLFGRSMMNQSNGVDAKGQPLAQGQMGMSNLMQMLPWLMMI